MEYTADLSHIEQTLQQKISQIAELKELLMNQISATERASADKIRQSKCNIQINISELKNILSSTRQLTEKMSTCFNEMSNSVVRHIQQFCSLKFIKIQESLRKELHLKDCQIYALQQQNTRLKELSRLSSMKTSIKTEADEDPAAFTFEQRPVSHRKNETKPKIKSFIEGFRNGVSNAPIEIKSPFDNLSILNTSMVKNESSMTRLSTSGIEITKKSVDKKENRQFIELGGNKKRESVCKVPRDGILIMNKHRQFGMHRLPL